MKGFITIDKNGVAHRVDALVVLASASRAALDAEAAGEAAAAEVALASCIVAIEALGFERRQAGQSTEPSLYAARASDGRVKIGISRSLATRVADLRGSAGLPIQMLGALPPAARLERQIHKLLKAHRTGGEWFAPCPEVDEVARAVEVLGRQNVDADSALLRSAGGAR